jgi:hypothetical protein
MDADSEKRKLVELRVVDLRAELERRSLDKTGVKAVLIERLQKVSKAFVARINVHYVAGVCWRGLCSNKTSLVFYFRLFEMKDMILMNIYLNRQKRRLLSVYPVQVSKQFVIFVHCAGYV